MYAVFFHRVSATCLEWKIYSAEMIHVNLVGDIIVWGIVCCEALRGQNTGFANFHKSRCASVSIKTPGEFQMLSFSFTYMKRMQYLINGAGRSRSNPS